MNRRDFLKSALAAGMLYTAGGLPALGRIACASGFAPLADRVLVNIMLSGGPDMRHLLPPPFDVAPGSFGHEFWKAKASAHSIGDSAAAWQSRWETDYFHVGSGQTGFGILKSCGWLKRMWDAGNVAIVSNALGGTTRNHSHCELILDQGDTSSGPNDFERSGWGGRLGSVAGGNVLALTRSPRRFCYGPHPLDPESHDNSNMIAARNMRQMSLYKAPTADPLYSRAIITRAIHSYYAAKRQEISSESVYHQFIKHYDVAHDFGGALDDRFDSVPLPVSLRDLSLGGLDDVYFGQQIQNLHDALACSDILALRVASLEFNNWDSHRGQKDLIEPHLNDLFGDGKALDVLFQELPADVAGKLVIVIAGEFGRQLRANLDSGCDHGEGNSVIIIGQGVNGGVYGDMFPADELARINDPSPQITGLTSIERIFGEVCDWVSPASGDIVFPDRALAPIETGVSLGGLFA